MSPDFTVAPEEIRRAGQCLADEASSLAQLRLDAPDVSMYGKLVGSAAADAEPATTADVNALLAALSHTVQALGDRAEQTCTAYTAAEEGNVTLGHAIGAALGGGAS